MTKNQEHFSFSRFMKMILGMFKISNWKLALDAIKPSTQVAFIGGCLVGTLLLLITHLSKWDSFGNIFISIVALGSIIGLSLLCDFYTRKWDSLEKEFKSSSKEDKTDLKISEVVIQKNTKEKDLILKLEQEKESMRRLVASRTEDKISTFWNKEIGFEIKEDTDVDSALIGIEKILKEQKFPYPKYLSDVLQEMIKELILKSKPVTSYEFALWQSEFRENCPVISEWYFMVI